VHEVSALICHAARVIPVYHCSRQLLNFWHIVNWQ